MSQPPSDRALALASGAILALLVPIVGRAQQVLLATWDHNPIRLLRSAALLDGQPLFPQPGTGWITASMYGPVSAAAYLPAFLATSPSAAVIAGQALSLLFFCLGAVAVVLATPETRRPWGPSLAALALIGSVSFDLWALRYPALTIHADAPTLALGAIAIAFHSRRERNAYQHAAALCAVLAVWSKQVAIGVPLGLLLHIWWVDGRRQAIHSAVRWTGWGIAVSGVFVALFGPIRPMIYHLVTVPGAQPWNWGGGAGALGRSLALLVTDNLVLVGLGGLMLVLAAFDRTPSGPHGEGRQRLGRAAAWTAPAMVALASLPFALLGRAKVAGDVNAYSHCLFFLLLAVAVSLRDWSRVSTHSPMRSLARWLLAVVPAITLATAVVTEYDRVLAVPDHHIPYAELTAYIADRPGTVYLPRLGLVTWYAEQRLDHQAPGLSDYRAANIPIQRDHLLAGVPPAIETVVFYDNPWSEQWRLFDALGLRPVEPIPELADCLVFEARP